VAMALESQLPTVAARTVPAGGVAGALVLVVLPGLTLLFWASGCLVRSVIALIAPHRP
jgi:hypothetical protein